MSGFYNVYGNFLKKKSNIKNIENFENIETNIV